jgi:hypothetical protein
MEVKETRPIWRLQAQWRKENSWSSLLLGWQGSPCSHYDPPWPHYLSAHWRRWPWSWQPPMAHVGYEASWTAISPNMLKSRYYCLHFTDKKGSSERLKDLFKVTESMSGRLDSPVLVYTWCHVLHKQILVQHLQRCLWHPRPLPNVLGPTTSRGACWNHSDGQCKNFPSWGRHAFKIGLN